MVGDKESEEALKNSIKRYLHVDPTKTCLRDADVDVDERAEIVIMQLRAHNLDLRQIDRLNEPYASQPVCPSRERRVFRILVLRHGSKAVAASKKNKGQELEPMATNIL